MDTDLEKAINTIQKATLKQEQRQKQLQGAIKTLESEYQIALTEHRMKMVKLKADSDKEEKAIIEKNATLRSEMEHLTMEVATVRTAIGSVKKQITDETASHKAKISDMKKQVDAEIAKKRLELDGINHAIKEARKMIGVA